MVVLVLERVPIVLRGELTRWMLEIRSGVFVGTLTPVVRDRLWRRACQEMAGGAGILVYSVRNEQGFSVDLWGDPSRSVVDIEGLRLVEAHLEG
ncbi:MAG: type I-E CRISPR-associated endoribonuclease Cas2 [Acidobacteriia bacterium]|nr:type I-E CRISPR-associated endoribonuclease Cas2 [Terriglobia bacterium]